VLTVLIIYNTRRSMSVTWGQHLGQFGVRDFAQFNSHCLKVASMTPKAVQSEAAYHWVNAGGSRRITKFRGALRPGLPRDLAGPWPRVAGPHPARPPRLVGVWNLGILGIFEDFECFGDAYGVLWGRSFAVLGYHACCGRAQNQLP
jgi:hypothetical protein